MLALLPDAGQAAGCPREVSRGDHSQPRVAMVMDSRCHHQLINTVAQLRDGLVEDGGRARDL